MSNITESSTEDSSQCLVSSFDQKKAKIKQSLKETKQRRKQQSCFVRELKINTSQLSKVELNNLHLLFIEAKWLRNSFIASKDDFKTLDLSKNLTHVKGFDKNKNEVLKPIKTLSSQIKQSIQTQLKNDIKSLAKLKEKGYEVGAITYTSNVNSIDLKQYNVTWAFKDDFKKVKIQGIKSSLKVHGLKQFAFNEINYEFANAKLIKKASGFYIKITYYLDKLYLKSKQNPNKIENVGVDFGIRENLTTSDGKTFNILIKESEASKKAQRALSRMKKGSNNYRKMNVKLNRAFEKITNQRQDKANKIVSYLKNNYKTIYLQDENIAGWHKGDHGKTIQNSALGTIKSKLLILEESVIIKRSVKSTKECFCGNIIDIEKEKIFFCPKCNYIEDRDIKAAKFIKKLGENNLYIIDKKMLPSYHKYFEDKQKSSADRRDSKDCPKQ